MCFFSSSTLHSKQQPHPYPRRLDIHPRQHQYGHVGSLDHFWDWKKPDLCWSPLQMIKNNGKTCFRVQNMFQGESQILDAQESCTTFLWWTSHLFGHLFPKLRWILRSLRSWQSQVPPTVRITCTSWPSWLACKVWYRLQINMRYMRKTGIRLKLCTFSSAENVQGLGASPRLYCICHTPDLVRCCSLEWLNINEDTTPTTSNKICRNIALALKTRKQLASRESSCTFVNPFKPHPGEGTSLHTAKLKAAWLARHFDLEIFGYSPNQ